MCVPVAVGIEGWVGVSDSTLRERAMAPPRRMSGGHLIAWAADFDVTFDETPDAEGSYIRKRMRDGREPQGCIIARWGGRRWYFAPIESAADREARGLVMGLMMIGGGV